MFLLSSFMYYLQYILHEKIMIKITKLHYLGAIFQSSVFFFKGRDIFQASAFISQWHLTGDRKKPTRSALGTKRVNKNLRDKSIILLITERKKIKIKISY